MSISVKNTLLPEKKNTHTQHSKGCLELFGAKPEVLAPAQCQETAEQKQICPIFCSLPKAAVQGPDIHHDESGVCRVPAAPPHHRRLMKIQDTCLEGWPPRYKCGPPPLTRIQVKVNFSSFMSDNSISCCSRHVAEEPSPTCLTRERGLQ